MVLDGQEDVKARTNLPGTYSTLPIVLTASVGHDEVGELWRACAVPAKLSRDICDPLRQRRGHACAFAIRATADKSLCTLREFFRRIDWRGLVGWAKVRSSRAVPTIIRRIAPRPHAYPLPNPWEGCPDLHSDGSC